MTPPTTDLALPASFFAPVPRSEIIELMRDHEKQRVAVTAIADIFTDADRLGAVEYFQKGNQESHGRMGPAPKTLFRFDGAIRALDAEYWRKAIDLTDIYDVMPAARRQEWNKSILDMKTPPFNKENVLSTFEALFAGRGKFFAERVDSIFQGLSGDHVTNSPGAFRKRMIINYVFSYYDHGHGCKYELIDDLRKVIAKFLGHDEPHYSSTRSILEICRTNHGQWHAVDGGALRIRCYLKGTAHLEVHPDMAWRLNAVLHTLYPNAIAPKDRRREKKPKKTIEPIQRPLPSGVLRKLAELRINRNGHEATLGYAIDKHVKSEMVRVLEMIGGVVDGEHIRFDYPVQSVIDEIVVSGCIPDSVSHQYYPTPEDVADVALGMLRIATGGRRKRVLEPSAGTGVLADRLFGIAPSVQIHCIEKSPLFCEVLMAKGHRHVLCSDFLDYVPPPMPVFDAVLMNPPYDRNQWRDHVEHALQFLTDAGQLVAILPASQHGKTLFDGYAHEWSSVLENRFANTSMDVAVVRIEKKVAS